VKKNLWIDFVFAILVRHEEKYGVFDDELKKNLVIWILLCLVLHADVSLSH
jgi:hypothetical protein